MKTASSVVDKVSVRKKALVFAHRMGLFDISHRLTPNSLTVLNYHRIGDVSSPEFDTFKPNVSASPEQFELQMEYLKLWFNVVSIRQIVNWLDGKNSLPPHAALITFDDGYLDNYLHAYPILQKNNLPAVIFLTTGYIQKDIPFYWDLVSYCFHYTSRDLIMFPNGKYGHWTSDREKEKIISVLIETLKLLPDDEKQAWISHLPSDLNISIPSGYFQSLMLNWEQIREMKSGGVEFGGHTVMHPILTRIPLGQAEKEISDSKSHIESEISEPIYSFAYPNGGYVDFNRDIEIFTAKSGYRLAFTLMNGPCTYREAKRNPFTIRRIFLSHKHNMTDFALLTNPVNRLRK